MGIALIFLGLFLWFALAFNGTVGETFVNYAFFTSALLMIISGSLGLINSKRKLARIICSAALVSYIPMLWQRFNFTYDTDWGGFYFDIGIVIFMLIFIAIKPNKSSNLTGANNAPPS